MVVNKGSVTIDKKIGSGNMQLVSEGEINAAEDKDIGSVLKCSGFFAADEIKTEEGRVSFGGRLLIEGMYLSKNEEKTICPFSHRVNVSDFINIEGAEGGGNMFTYADFAVSECECRVINERKLSFKAITDVSVSVRQQREIEYAEGLDPEQTPENQQRKIRLPIEYMAVEKRDGFTVKDSLTLPMGRPNIEKLLECRLAPSSVDYRAGDGEVRLSGDLNASVLYKGENESNPMELYQGVIPFKGQLQAEGVTSDMPCDVKLNIRDKFVSVQPDEDGEMRLIDIEAVMDAVVAARASEEITLLEDVYIPNKQVHLTLTQEPDVLWAAKNIGQCPIKEVIALDEGAPDMLQIYTAEGRAFIDFAEINEGRVDIDGAVEVSILYVTGNDICPAYCFKGALPFKHIAQAAGAKRDMDCTVKAEMEHISFNMLSGREVEIRCVVNLSTLVEQEQMCSFVTNVETEELSREYLNSLAGITLYTVRKGDTLWKLAKRYNTTVEDIAAVNDIENPDLIYPGQRLIIVKRVG